MHDDPDWTRAIGDARDEILAMGPPRIGCSQMRKAAEDFARARAEMADFEQAMADMRRALHKPEWKRAHLNPAPKLDPNRLTAGGLPGSHRRHKRG